MALFESVRALDLERIVAKCKYAPYGNAREDSTWYRAESNYLGAIEEEIVGLAK